MENDKAAQKIKYKLILMDVETNNLKKKDAHWQHLSKSKWKWQTHLN